MALQFIGSAAGTTSVTMPTHAIGDLMIFFAYRDGSTTNPTIGTGSPTTWTSITNTTDGTSCSVSAGWKIAAATNETSGTWTNASRCIVLVYRGQLSSGTPIGTFQPTSGTTSTITYTTDALTNSNVIGSSWFCAFAGMSTVDTALETPPTGMTLRQNDVDATAEASAFDTNGPATANWPSTNVSAGGTNGNWVSMVIEIKAQGAVINNYQFMKSSGSNAGILSFGERIQ